MARGTASPRDYGGAAPASFRPYGAAGASSSPYEAYKSTTAKPTEFKFQFGGGSSSARGDAGKTKPMPPNSPRPPSGTRAGSGAPRRPAGQPGPGHGQRRLVEASPRPASTNQSPGRQSPSVNRAASVYLQQPKRAGSARPGSGRPSSAAVTSPNMMGGSVTPRGGVVPVPSPRGGTATTPRGAPTPRGGGGASNALRVVGMVNSPRDQSQQQQQQHGVSRVTGGGYTPRYSSPTVRQGYEGGYTSNNPYRPQVSPRPGSGSRTATTGPGGRPATNYGAFSTHTGVTAARRASSPGGGVVDTKSPRPHAPMSARGAGHAGGAASVGRSGTASAPATPRDVQQQGYSPGPHSARAAVGGGHATPRAMHVGGSGAHGAMAINQQRRTSGGAWSTSPSSQGQQQQQQQPQAGAADSPNFVDMWAGKEHGRSPGSVSQHGRSPGSAHSPSPGRPGSQTARGWEDSGGRGGGATAAAAASPAARPHTSGAETDRGAGAYGRSTVTTVPEEAVDEEDGDDHIGASATEDAYAQAQHRIAQQYAASQQAHASTQPQTRSSGYGQGSSSARSASSGVSVEPHVQTTSRRPDSAQGALPGYTVGRVLGEGGFCKVRLGAHHMSGKKVAVKVIDKTKLVEVNDRRRVGREIRVIKRLVHENIIRCFEVVDSPSKVFVVMEYADGGSLLDYVRARKRLEEAEAAVFFHQVLAGLAYCHRHMVVHRDIKLENLLLDSNRHMKVIDFGLSAIITPGKKLRVHCGSPSYAAPEIVSRKLYDGPPVDVWSLGVVLFAMVSGYLPFHAGGNKHELCHKIIRGHYVAPDFISPDVRDLLRLMLTVDPTQRITVDQLFQHRWVRSGPAYATPERAVFVRMDRGSSHHTADGEVLDHMVNTQGWDRQSIVDNLLAGEHNYITASYYLLMETKAAAERRAAVVAMEQAAAKGLPYTEPAGSFRYPSQGEPAPQKSPEAISRRDASGGMRPGSAPPARPKVTFNGKGGGNGVGWRGDSAASVTEKGGAVAVVSDNAVGGGGVVVAMAGRGPAAAGGAAYAGHAMARQAFAEGGAVEAGA